VINVQGDEPFIDAEPLAKVIEVFRNDLDKSRFFMREITNEEDINNPNNVKWLWIKMDFCTFRFGNSYPREKNVGVRYIGIYAFRKQALLIFLYYNQCNLWKHPKIGTIALFGI
jgi:3-deoxy-manno-octulosonate cytidylyltransferase (CMP-KDO synthetase)